MDRGRVEVRPRAAGERYRRLLATDGRPVLALDLGALRHQYDSLRAALPGVEFFYAIKSLPHRDVIAALSALGCGFDVATAGEIALVPPATLNARRCIHTHPIKRDADIRAALRSGCTTFVVDNPCEIDKFAPFARRVGLLLRLSFVDAAAQVDLSRKFGCEPDAAGELLDRARALGVHVKGLSFHVGSQCKDGRRLAEAVRACGRSMVAYSARVGRPMTLLDIGGGFPVPYGPGVPSIEAFCAPIRQALRELPDDFRVIAEPGRFLSAPIGTCISQVMGKALRGGVHWYYLNDGVYGSYSGQVFDHAEYPLEVFGDGAATAPSVLAGPTCDGIDVIAEGIQLPALEVGDLVVGHYMGAYTCASATDFNFFDRAELLVVDGLEPVRPGAFPAHARPRPSVASSS